MGHRARHSALLAVLLALAVAVLDAAPAQAAAPTRGRPWPGHPDRALVGHVVRPGDTATGLATRYHAWTRELVALNHLDRAGTLRVGERIRIPVVLSALPRHRKAAAKPTSTPTSTATPTPTPKPTPARSSTVDPKGWRHWRMGREEVKGLIAHEAVRRGVPVRLAQAVAWQESGWYQPVRSPAGALGVMQVLPATGLWMSLYAGRPLDLRDTHDNVTAGVTLLRVLLDRTSSTRRAVGAYYQGLGAVQRHGLYPSTKQYVASVLALRRQLSSGARLHQAG